MQSPRLSVVDDMFYRGHHGRGVEVAMQGIWRFADHVDPADLTSFHALLSQSSLTRRVISPRFPWARRCFVDDAIVAPLRVDPDVITAGSVVSWADEQGRTALDVDDGPAWELALGHLDDGGSVVTMTCSHLVSDGLGLIGAADDAIDAPIGPAPDPRRRRPGWRPRLRDDIADAVSLWATVIVGVVRSLVNACTDRTARAELFAALRRHPTSDRPATHAETTAVVEVDAAQWDRHVTQTGSTSTAFTTALAADLVVDVRGRGPVEVTVPMAGNGRALTMAEISVSDPAQPARCAADLRSAYRRAGSGTGLGPPGGMPAELLQLLGDRIAHAVVPDPGGREALVSPLGDLGTAFDALGAHRSTGLAVRSVHPHPDDAANASSSMLLGVWTARTCGRVVLSLVSRGDLDGRRLGDVAVACLARRGVTATSW